MVFVVLTALLYQSWSKNESNLFSLFSSPAGRIWRNGAGRGRRRGKKTGLSGAGIKALSFRKGLLFQGVLSLLILKYILLPGFSLNPYRRFYTGVFPS